ncbi:hypothetical protein BUE76_22710 [Cnuella takakiae]|nr:hypothetical protein BUE76_22710 [Cnuella takakiae]
MERVCYQNARLNSAEPQCRLQKQTSKFIGAQLTEMKLHSLYCSWILCSGRISRCAFAILNFMDSPPF